MLAVSMTLALFVANQDGSFWLKAAGWQRERDMKALRQKIKDQNEEVERVRKEIKRIKQLANPAPHKHEVLIGW